VPTQSLYTFNAREVTDEIALACWATARKPHRDLRDLLVQADVHDGRSLCAPFGPKIMCA